MQAHGLIKESRLDKLVEISLLNCSVNKVAGLHASSRTDQGVKAGQAGGNQYLKLQRQQSR